MGSWIRQGWETNELSKGILKFVIVVKQRRLVLSGRIWSIVCSDNGYSLLD